MKKWKQDLKVNILLPLLEYIRLFTEP